MTGDATRGEANFTVTAEHEEDGVRIIDHARLLGIAAYKPGGFIAPLDRRWEWHEISTFSQPGPSYVRGLCRHLEVVPVNAVTGEIVAHLCLTCDQQLPEEWSA